MRQDPSPVGQLAVPLKQVCQAVDDLANQPGKLRGRRLAEVVNALNALGGTWQRVPSQPPATG